MAILNHMSKDDDEKNPELSNDFWKSKKIFKKKPKKNIIKKGNFKFNLKRGDWQCANS